MPRVSVICPTFNRSAAILPTIAGVRAQTVEDWELLVVSDGSTDDTDDIVRAVGDERIILRRVPRHGAPGGPRNAGIAAARAPFVAYLDHDDTWRPDHLEVLLSALEAGAPLASTGCVRVDQAGVVRESSGLLDMLWHPELQALNAMYEPSRVGHVRGLVPESGGWNTERAGFEDWDLWFRLSAAGVDFTPVAERTAVLTLDNASRRHTFAPARAIGLSLVDDEQHGRRVLARLAEPETATLARQRYFADLTAWYETLAVSRRMRGPAQVPADEVVAAARDKGATGFLTATIVAPAGDRFAIALPTAALSRGHQQEIRRLMWTRQRRQLDLLSQLVENTR